uniref:Transposase MuDR plant domain-containing protein n=1 Tax=Gossypium raimondii TaxID=29730 RepID=A0A0D2R4E0_GOSRA|nr:hypothetical protein B456_010G085000 [Gossypium raimondii]
MLLLVVGESDFEDDMLLLSAGESDFEGVEADGKGEVEGVQVDGEGDAEGGEADGEGDVERVQAIGEGVTSTQFEVDEYGDGMDNVATAVSEEEDRNETEVYDSDEHGSLVRSDKDEEHEDGERRISNLGMLFKDSKQFKSVIRNYFRQLKFLKNEPKRVVRILASYNPVAKCLQNMNFQKEHHCLVSFKNKMVTATMIAQHFEAIIKDHPKIKLREIQRRCASEMYVNVSIDCCYRAKKIYAHELRSKMADNTIKIAIQMVTTNSASYFKRFYVCFDTLKRGWKVRCRPLIGLDDCFLKSPFKSEFLAAVGRDVNNQMFPVAWAMVEVECTDSWV